MLRLLVAITLGRLAGALSRLLGRGGSALPGLVAQRLDPLVIEKLVASLPDGVVVVTGTNGKTTTTKLLVTALDRAGVAVLTNPTGSNLERGVATVLLQASRRGRIRGADLAVFEVDEAAARALASRLAPRLTVVTNLARDQLDRYGELDTTAGHLAATVAASDRAVLNADDPAVAALDAGRTAWFGAAEGLRERIPHDRVLYGLAGPEAPQHVADTMLTAATVDGDGQVVELRHRGQPLVTRLRVPGVYNGYNAAAALLAAAELGVDPPDAADSFELMAPAFGRGQVIEYGGRRVTLLLVKNPAGFNQAVALLAEAPPSAVLVAINDNHADGRDVSWLWDVQLDALRSGGHRFAASGIRATDMALRLKYAGIDAWADDDLERALQQTVATAPDGAPIYVIPTYTAMLRLLEILLPAASRSEVWT